MHMDVQCSGISNTNTGWRNSAMNDYCRSTVQHRGWGYLGHRQSSPSGALPSAPSSVKAAHCFFGQPHLLFLILGVELLFSTAYNHLP